jgi:hypothetical protein
MMMQPLKSVKKPLNGGTLTVTQFPVLRAVRVGARVAKIAGPVLAGLGSGLNLDDIVSGKMAAVLAGGEINLNKAVPGALNALAERLDPEELISLCLELLQSANWVDSAASEKIELTTAASIDLVFNGSIPDLFMALRASLEANNFFGLGAIGKLRGALGVPSPKPSPESLPQT